MLRCPGEQLGFRCLAQGHLSHGIKGGEGAVHSLPPPTIPAGPRLELATFWIMSPTLTIRPRLFFLGRVKIPFIQDIKEGFKFGVG